MGYSFEYRRDTARQVRKIARDQVESAIDLIEAGGDFDRTVHELRRRCKKVRGLLRLVRPNFADYDSENAHFRDAADSLSAARDAAVMVATYVEAIEQPWAAPIATADKDRVRAALADHAAAVAGEQNGASLLADFKEAMQVALPRIGGWSFKGNGFSLLEPGLRVTYSGLRKGLDRAMDSGEAEDFHDWRKDAKYHWFHVTLLKDCAPDVLGARRDHLGRLGEILGDHHNLFVLAEALKSRIPDAPPPIVDGLEDLQRELGARAFDLGCQLVVESPKGLTKRFGQFWKLLPEDK